MTKKFILGFTIIMFFFKSSATANYEKTFFDLNIESISGETINFRDFENKVIFYPLNSKSNLEIILKFPNNKEISCGEIKSPGSKVLEININEVVNKYNLNYQAMKSYLS